MSKIKIKNAEVVEFLVGEKVDFPKYTTQIINLANQNAQGTRPKVVGQMSDLIQEFPGQTYQEWVEWYQKRMPQAIDKATDKIYDMIKTLNVATQVVDRDLVKKWVRDLVLTKTFVGLKFQEAILKKISEIKMCSYTLADPKEESKGIDGYIGDVPVSIKAVTYKTLPMLREQITAKIIYYDKKKDGITIEFDF